MSEPEVWLRGPLPGYAPELQPVAHALLQAHEDLERAASLPAEQLEARPGKSASIGYHLRHLAGSLDRLTTYARGEQLSDAQMTALRAEAPTWPAPRRPASPHASPRSSSRRVASVGRFRAGRSRRPPRARRPSPSRVL